MKLTFSNKIKFIFKYLIIELIFHGIMELIEKSLIKMNKFFLMCYIL